ncbi:hypothetical protein BG015_004993 [Linnemannia schmuckeri]|uniref:C2H2-type domain-containing protein n=1 Tax=Linnemannia schmuckeri TaxID=64567 RepID=A0A9P5VCA0_9FUNG|nr:hypothetical protein BG015_004993 [Linnemannia schmuckeri]
MFHNQIPADDVSKMYTTLYDSEDPQQQQDFLIQQQRQYQDSQQFIQALLGQPASSWDEVSPPSPASSCFSSNSSNSSHSSPVTGLKTMDSEEADELADLFNITIDDLLLGTPLSFSADMSLFDPQQQFLQQQSMITEATQFAYMQTTEAQQQYFQTQQYQQQQHQQHYHNHSPSTPCSPCSPYHPMSPSMSSGTSTPFSAPASPLTTALPTMPHPSASPHTPADGTTVIKNEDGSIMVFNPSTDTVTFRCELCPTESFGRIHDLKRHQTSKHQQTTWPCEFCQRPFVRRDALLRHYTVKATRDDGIHPPTSDTETLLAVRARAKLIG